MYKTIKQCHNKKAIKTVSVCVVRCEFSIYFNLCLLYIIYSILTCLLLFAVAVYLIIFCTMVVLGKIVSNVQFFSKVVGEKNEAELHSVSLFSSYLFWI